MTGESTYLKKNDKGWNSQKGALKSLFSFGKRNKSQPHQDPPKKEGQLGTFGRETSKEESNEKMRKGPATNVANTTLILVPRVAKGGNQWHTKNHRKVL